MNLHQQNMITQQLPTLLIYSRIFLGIAIGLTAIINPDNSGLIISMLMFVAIVTDILDGIIARKLGVATQRLRILDSNVDLFFWLISLSAIFLLNPQFFAQHIRLILLVFFLEMLAYFVSFFKFRKSVATHTYLAKFWSVFLFLFLTELAVTGNSTYLFWVVIGLGCLSRIEIILILWLTPIWKTDISSIFNLFNT